jgi:hypothetical protein
VEISPMIPAIAIDVEFIWAFCGQARWSSVQFSSVCLCISVCVCLFVCLSVSP